MIDALLNSLDLKEEERTGWKLRKIRDSESVADHSWSVSLLTLVYGHVEDINLDKAIRMSIIHDLAETEIGDIPSRADEDQQDISDKEKESMELSAIIDISKDLDRHEIRQLWKEYNMENTPEAKFVKDMDKVEMCLQALKYYNDGRYSSERDKDRDDRFEALDEFFVTSEPEIQTDLGKELFEEIRSRYQSLKNKKDQD